MDLIEALEAASIEYHEGRDEEEIYLCCPFCTDDRFRLGINIRTGAAHCFNDGCEWSARGDYAFRKLQEVLDTGEIEAKETERKRKKKRMEKLQLPDGFQRLDTKDESHWYNKAHTFVRKRGVSREQIRDKKIGYTITGPLTHRIIFPVYLSGVLVGLVGRAFIDSVEPKYKNSIGAKCLYNLPEKKHTSICLSEGVFDTLAIERGGKKLGIDSAGLLGHSIKDDQIDLLHHYKRVYLWLDPDDAGLEGLIGIYKKLKDTKKSLRVILPKGMLDDKDFDKRDPSEMECEEIVKRLDKAESLTEGMMQKIQAWRAFDE